MSPELAAALVSLITSTVGLVAALTALVWSKLQDKRIDRIQDKQNGITPIPRRRKRT